MGHARGIAGEHWPQLAAIVDGVIEARTAVAKAQAAESRLLADAIDLVLARAGAGSADRDLPLREVAAELGAAMRTSDRTVQRRMGDAFALREGFSATMTAWEQGEIDSAHVAAILSAGTSLDTDHRPRYENFVLEVAREESAGRLQGIARAIAAQIDPDGADRRIREAESDRQVRIYDTGDGMSRLLADLPAVLAHGIHDRLTQQARAVRDADRRELAEGDEVQGLSAETPQLAAPDATTRPATVNAPTGDTRTIDQLRADIFCDTLLSGAPVPRRGTRRDRRPRADHRPPRCRRRQQRATRAPRRLRPRLRRIRTSTRRCGTRVGSRLDRPRQRRGTRRRPVPPLG